MAKKYLLSSDEALTAGPSIVGMKAYNLAIIGGGRFSIPQWCVIPVGVFEDFLDHNKLTSELKKLASDDLVNQDQVHRLREKISAGNFPKEFADEIENWLGSQSSATNLSFAVRSSSPIEDGEAQSFAGCFATTLCQKNVTDILKSISTSFASVLNAPLKGESPLTMAVILQTMVKAEVAGVMFTAHPTFGRWDLGLLSCTQGLGEGVVNGSCQTDQYVINWSNNNITVSIVEKDFIIVDRGWSSGTVRASIPDFQKSQPSITEDQARRIFHVGKEIAVLKAGPQDIEWAMDKENLFILQTRPITRVAVSENSEPTITWDNANIQESYNGVTTPLTFSFASTAYASVYDQTMRWLGVTKRVRDDHHDCVNSLLGYVAGKIYYNIDNWYQLLSLLPFQKKNASAMEEMMGISAQNRKTFDKGVNANSSLRKSVAGFATFSRLIASFFILPVFKRRFMRRFDECEGVVDRGSLCFVSLSALFEKISLLENKLIRRWTAPIINDLLVMMLNHICLRLLRSVSKQNTELALSEVLSSRSKITASLIPLIGLEGLVDIVKKNPELLNAMTTLPSDEIEHAVSRMHISFYQKCQKYITQFGDRCVGELKLETRTMREDPAMLFNLLRQKISNEKPKHISDAKLKKSYRIGLLKSTLVTLLCWSINSREEMRLVRAKAFGLYRSIYREIGKRMALLGLTEKPEDIFFLTTDEIKAFSSGRLVNYKIKELVKLRKVEFDNNCKLKLPSRFKSFLLADGLKCVAASPSTGDETALSGICVSSGIVNGEVLIITDPGSHNDLSGKIFCAERTDPGWLPYLSMASGLIIEKGSPLSHSAIVARELGIPSIVNVANATQILKSGEPVILDANAGIVRRVKNKLGLASQWKS